MIKTLSPRPRHLAGAWLALGLATLAACASAPATEPRPAAPRPAPAPAEAPAPTAAPQSSEAPRPAAAGADEPALAQRFARWLAEFSHSAREAGIAETTLRAAFDDVRYLPRVIELDRAQPEFTRTTWDYLDRALTPRRIAQGQQMLLLHQREADAAAARHGVPPAILVAIWGLESSYGANTGDIPTIDALATLGFDGRRADWARGQLLAALKILQNGDIDRAQMIGSWAGAMGQTQFLPSSFLAYAVDADGDGRRDIWASVGDVMFSTANFLARSGWQAGQPWGAEVVLPAGFDVGLADPQLRQSSARWAALGVLPVADGALPALDDAALLLPAGARGPAFLVGPNFRAILRYNNSTSYALAVGLLAQRLAGGPGVSTPWPRDQQALSRSQLVELQTALNRRGFDSGAADGLMGPTTRDAIRRYQRSLGLPADGYPDLGLLQGLLAGAAP